MVNDLRSTFPLLLAHKVWSKSVLFNSVSEGLSKLSEDADTVMQAATGDYRLLPGYPCEYFDMKWDAMADLTGFIMQKVQLKISQPPILRVCSSFTFRTLV